MATRIKRNKIGAGKVTITLNADFVINFIAWFITLCILILPIFGTVKLCKAIVNKVRGKKRRQTIEFKPNSTKTESTDWQWNEERQLWVHPKSEKTSTGDTSYRISGEQILNHKTAYKQEHTVESEAAASTAFQDAISRIREAAEKAPESNTSYSFSKSAIHQDETRREKWHRTYQEPETKNPQSSEYHNAYEATPILTKNEYHNFKTLNEAAMKRGYMVWSKVRLADIVKPRNDSKYMSHFGKIKSKHVDFVILDQNMKIKAIIELDDKSHDRADRKARDEFVDLILQDCGYKIIHTRYITPNILDSV